MPSLHGCSYVRNEPAWAAWLGEVSPCARWNLSQVDNIFHMNEGFITPDWDFLQF